MSTLQIEPAEGYIALEFLDEVAEDDEEPEQRQGYAGAPTIDNEGLFAMVVGVGKKVTNCKRGDTVVVSKWAKEGMRIGDDVVLCDSYVVKAIVKAPKK